MKPRVVVRPSPVSRSLLLALVVLGSSRVASAEEAIFGEDFECGTIGAWSNGGTGVACLQDTDCLTAYCQNGYCCEGGDCCQTAEDCTAYAEDAICDDDPTCQGSRSDAVCNCRRECASESVDDDSGCTSEVLALGCSPYVPVFCAGTSDQGAPSCPSTCSGDGDCVEAAHCDGTCFGDLAPGESCDETSDCAAGSCTDAVCCSSSCVGLCRSCVVEGSEGSCAPIPSGEDPDGECGAVSCTGYYWGWAANSCYRRASVSAASATCDGALQCGSQAQECSQSGQGSVFLTCPMGQVPNLSTCTGTIAGACVPAGS